MRNSLLVIEPQRDYDAIVSAYLPDPSDLPRIFLAHPLHQKRLIEAAESQGVDLSDALIHYHAVDRDTDEYLYETAAQLAGDLYDITRTVGGAVYRNAEGLIPAMAKEALVNAMLDRFAGQLRAPVRLQRILARRFDEVAVVPRPKSPAHQVRSLFAGLGIDQISFRVDHLAAAHLPSGSDQLDPSGPYPDELFAGPDQLSALKEYDYRALAGHVADGRTLVYFAHLHDRQYQLTALSVLQQLDVHQIQAVTLSYLPANPDEYETLSEEQRSALLSKQAAPASAVTLSKTGLKRHRSALIAISRRLHAHLATHRDPLLRACAWLVVDHVRTYFGPILRFAERFVRHMSPIVKHLDCVVVSPGRYPEAQLLVSIANAHGVPTVEIQGGPISTSARFIRPRARDVLCIDPFSFDVYSAFLGHAPDRTHVVGGPKIDRDLAPFRGVSKQQARDAIREEIDVGEGFLVLFTSQPIGMESMLQVARIAIGGVSAVEGATLLIKQHPNEDAAYGPLYAAMAQQLGFTRMVTSKTVNVHHAILAADLVTTYFSTTGLESFCLDRPVACLNPYTTRPPYDLVKIGVATEMVTADDLTRFIKTGRFAAGNGDSRLALLKDGRAGERCAEHLATQWRTHRSRNRHVRPLTPPAAGDTLLVVEPQGGYDAIVEHYLADGGELPRIFLPDTAHQRSLVDAATRRGIDLGDNVLAVPTIDAKTQIDLYATAEQLADMLMHISTRYGEAAAGDLDDLLPRPARRAVGVAMLYRFLGELHGPMRLRTVLEDGGFSGVSLVAGPDCGRRRQRSLLNEMGVRRIAFRTEHLAPDQRLTTSDIEAADGFAIADTMRLLPEYDYAEIGRHVEDGVSLLFSTNLHVHQHRLTALPVIYALQRLEVPMIVMVNHEIDHSRWEPFEIAPSTTIVAKPPSRGTDLHHGEHAGVSDALREIIRQFYKRLVQHDNAFVRACAWTLTDYARIHLGPLLHFAASFCANMQPLIPQLDCVVATPGRSAESQMLLRIARNQKIPTTEIQSGAVTRTSRFFRPVAKELLCTDPWSADTYTTSLGHPPNRTLVVGSPKLDYELERYRSTSRADACATLRKQHSIPDGRIFTLISQPIGADAMADVVSIAASGIGESTDMVLFIRQHRNEDAAYAAAYRAVAERFGLRSIVLSKTADIHVSMLAADLVMTYDAAAGVKAFCLGRPVVCLNPFADRPPVDLVSQGLANEVTTGEELREHLRRDVGPSGDSDARSRMLRDGGASERCATHIRSQVERHRRRARLATAAQRTSPHAGAS